MHRQFSGAFDFYELSVCISLVLFQVKIPAFAQECNPRGFPFFPYELILQVLRDEALSSKLKDSDNPQFHHFIQVI